MNFPGRSRRNNVLTAFLSFLLCVSVGYAQNVFDSCGMEGSAKRANGKELNKKKNRWDIPKLAQFNDSVTFTLLLQSDSLPHGFHEGQAATIYAYVANVKLGSKETCNCGKKDTAHRDTHIELTLIPEDATDKTKILVVEVTPRFQRMKKAEGLDWTTKGIKDAFLGRWVKVQGWIYFDKVHADESAGSDNENIWRGSAWELHPVTSIEITERPLQQCSAITSKGARCTRMTSSVSGRCWQHDR